MKNVIKQKVTRTAQNLSYSLGLSPRLAKRSNAARILMFHGISDEHHSEDVFAKQINFANENFTIVSLDHMLAMVDAGEKFTDELVLTFDDGLKNNATHAYEILRKSSTPATFYVCPGLIESGSWLWNQEARERLRSMPAPKLAALAADWNCSSGVEGVVSWMKGLKTSSRVEIENRLRLETAEFTPSAEQRNAYDMMSWDDLKNLDADLITIGSHTANHVIAKGLSDDDLKLEIVGSRRQLENELDRPIKHFCYPNGDFDRATIDEVRKTYQSAVTTKEGLVRSGDDQFLLNRIPSANSLSYFAWRMFRPES